MERFGWASAIAPRPDGAGERVPVESKLVRVVAVGQGTYYLATGLWALVHMPSFERVTGPKTDRWLVRTVGVLVGAVGASLALAGLRRNLTRELALLAGSSAVGLGAIDVVYASTGRISGVYFLDAAVETVLAGAWLVGWSRVRPRTRARLERVDDWVEPAVSGQRLALKEKPRFDPKAP